VRVAETRVDTMRSFRELVATVEPTRLTAQLGIAAIVDVPPAVLALLGAALLQGRAEHLTRSLRAGQDSAAGLARLLAGCPTTSRPVRAATVVSHHAQRRVRSRTLRRGSVPAAAGRMSEIAHPGPAPSFPGAQVSERTAAPTTPARVRKGRLRTGTRRALQVVVVLALVVIAAAVVHRMLTRPASVRVGAAVAGTVREEVIGPGTVQSRYSVSVGSRVAGTIDRVLVDVGDEVQKDQLLATLDRTELDARFRATRGAVASAQQNVALARANREKAHSDLDLARIQHERAQELVGSGVIPVAEADDARGALRAAEADERAARAAVEARGAERARLTEEQRVAETIRSYTALKSPMAGIITRRALEPGSAVAAGAVVFQIVDPNALWVATLIDQSLAGRVVVGQRAVIRLRSGAEKGGRVARIALEADPVTRELEVDVAFDERPPRFAIHEEADVRILGEQTKGLTVPLDALSDGPVGSGVFVYVVEDGRARRQDVRLGMIGAKMAVVVGGLSEGAPVILTPGAVRDGQPVAVAGRGK
jgi:multidrug efflux system membrane fusion protein